jgi:hypothetical protein
MSAAQGCGAVITASSMRIGNSTVRFSRSSRDALLNAPRDITAIKKQLTQKQH